MQYLATFCYLQITTLFRAPGDDCHSCCRSCRLNCTELGLSLDEMRTAAGDCGGGLCTDCDK